MKQTIRLVLATAAPLLAQVTINDNPSREFGQPVLSIPVLSAAPNLVEGREFNAPSAIAFDYSVTPPAVYVADTGNNRVLAWKNSAALANGAAADLVIGQRDFYSTLPQGPSQAGSTLSSGLFAPVGVAVDSSGNLYVIDAGNNRVLRYPTPLSQTGGLLPVDLAIGQKSVNGSGNAQPNEGNPKPSNRSLYLAYGTTIYRAALTLDAQGSLWIADPGNNRILRFPAANLAPNTTEPTADLVLGQLDFTSSQGPQPPNNVQINKSAVVQPSGLAFDSAARLYVADGFGRVLVYQAPATTGQSADRVLGIQPTPAQGQTAPRYPTNYSLGVINPNGTLAGSPQGVFTSGANLFVCDTAVHRVVRYDVYGNWSPETVSSPSPASVAVTGQPDLLSGKVNRGLLQPDATSLSSPVAGAYNTAAGEIWIVDTGNNRILVFPQQAGQYNAAARVLGQIDFPYNSPNLIEGREVSFMNQGGIVVDKTSNPPHLYIADTGNNRVLGFLDARSVGTDSRTLLTQKADLVIGQPDLLHSLPNYSPSNVQPSDALTPNSTGLIAPVGLAVDANGNLFVADSGNGRVLRFPAPFSQLPGLPRATLVLGQSSFTSTVQDPSAATMNTPYGIAQFNDGSLAVSDAIHNRILIFQKPAGGDFTSGQPAAIVVGQTGFNSINAGSSLANLSGPRHLATDTSDRLYVCDTNNNRMLVFTNASRSSNGASAALVLPGIGQPEGVAVSTITGESWVTNTGGNQLLRFPEFTSLQLNPQPTAGLNSPEPLSVALDPFDNLIVGEGANRISFYFPKMYYRHAATYAAGTNSPVNLTPGMLALLARYGSDFSLTPAGNQAVPWPTSGLNDIQVMVNGISAPIFRLDPAVVYFQVPNAAPISGTADVLVLKPSTGQILAAATFTMQAAAPGIFTANQAGTGQAAATNADGSANSSTNAVTRGGIITLWLTGAGFIPNLPPDGVAPGAAISTPVQPKVFMNGLPATNIEYSGVSPQFPGLWQINVQVPNNTAPGPNVSVLVTMYDYPSNYGGTSATGGPGADQQLTVGNKLVPTIAVK
ncbi:MAG: hypothetical protein JO307_20095 [Bryobacterales bacterium]|nr:hypothetical protein [Bryobacterales bacterium]